VKSNFGSVEAQFGSQPQTLLRIHQAAPSILINILSGSALPRRSRGRWYRIPYQHHNEQSHRHIVHITATMSAAPAGRAARQLATDLFSPTTQKPLQSLLSQVYGKPVELNLVQLKRPQLNSDILASLVTQKLKDRRNTPRRVIRDVVWKAQLPTSQSQVPSQADHAAAATKALAKDPSTSSMARAKAPIGHIMHSLRLKQVSSIRVGANGRLGKRMTANRADKKTARKGLTSKGPGFVVRGTRKNHTDYSFLAGKRRVGAFGIKVSIGHS
jgi:hypothetical protein